MLNSVRIFPVLLIWASGAFFSWCNVEKACAQKSAPVVSLTAEERVWLKAHPNITRGYTDSLEPDVIISADGTINGGGSNSAKYENI